MNLKIAVLSGDGIGPEVVLQTKKIIDFAQENPETLDMLVVSSSDDEGNSFSPVAFAPTKGIYENREFIDEGSIEDFERDKEEINAVCIN